MHRENNNVKIINTNIRLWLIISKLMSGIINKKQSNASHTEGSMRCIN